MISVKNKIQIKKSGKSLDYKYFWENLENFGKQKRENSKEKNRENVQRQK